MGMAGFTMAILRTVNGIDLLYTGQGKWFERIESDRVVTGYSYDARIIYARTVKFIEREILADQDLDSHERTLWECRCNIFKGEVQRLGKGG